MAGLARTRAVVEVVVRSACPQRAKRDRARRELGRGALVPISLSGVGVAALPARMHRVADRAWVRLAGHLAATGAEANGSVGRRQIAGRRVWETGR